MSNITVVTDTDTVDTNEADPCNVTSISIEHDNGTWLNNQQHDNKVQKTILFIKYAPTVLSSIAPETNKATSGPVNWGVVYHISRNKQNTCGINFEYLTFLLTERKVY